jgi:hypothetical protein
VSEWVKVCDCCWGSVDVGNVGERKCYFTWEGLIAVCEWRRGGYVLWSKMLCQYLQVDRLLIGWLNDWLGRNVPCRILYDCSCIAKVLCISENYLGLRRYGDNTREPSGLLTRKYSYSDWSSKSAMRFCRVCHSSRGRPLKPEQSRTFDTRRNTINSKEKYSNYDVQLWLTRPFI